MLILVLRRLRVRHWIVHDQTAKHISGPEIDRIYRRHSGVCSDWLRGDRHSPIEREWRWRSDVVRVWGGKVCGLGWRTFWEFTKRSLWLWLRFRHGSSSYSASKVVDDVVLVWAAVIVQDCEAMSASLVDNESAVAGRLAFGGFGFLVWLVRQEGF